MIYLPALLGIIAAAYMTMANNAVQKRNAANYAIRNALRPMPEAEPYLEPVVWLVAVVGIGISTLLWLGPDGVEAVRQFMAPRVVVVHQ